MRNALGLLGSGSAALLLAVACGGGGDDATNGSSGSSGTNPMGNAGKGAAANGGTSGTTAGHGNGGTGMTTGGGAGTSSSGGAGGTTGGASGAGTVGGGAGMSGGSGGAMGGSAGAPPGAGGATGGAGSAGTAAGGTAGTGVTVGGFTIDVKLASAVQPTAPTTVGIVTWSLDKTGLTAAHIDFGLDTTYGMTAPVDLTAAMYKTLLLGMKPMKTYHFRIVASDAGGMYTSEDQTVTTGAKTTLVSFASFTIKDAAKADKGFFIGSFWQGNGSTVPYIVDSDGDVVWWYSKASGESADGISRARLSADSNNIWLVNETLSGAPLRRISMDTLDVQTYSSTKASHDICAVTGSTMAYLDYSESDCNSIFEITPTTTDKGKEVFESTGVTGSGSFPSCHGNAVRYSKKEDYYTYSDWQKDIAVVDRTGALKWKLSDKTGGNTAWGGKQHGHQLLDNSIILFANDSAGASKSQAVEFGLDGTLIKKFNSGGGATNFGDVQRLPSGNTLITYSTSNLVQEVDSTDAVVLEFKSSSSLGYIEYRKNLYDEPLDSQ